MGKLLYFATLSFVTMLFFFMLKVIINHPEKAVFIPENLRLIILDSIFNGGGVEGGDHIIGTSHVQSGFDDCKNNSIILSFESSMSGDVSIHRANALVLLSAVRNTDKINLILELTLIDSVLAQNQTEKGGMSSYFSDVFSVLSSLIENKIYSRYTNCSYQKEINGNFNVDLLGSQIVSDSLDDSEVNSLFLKYKESLKKLVHFCNYTNNVRITLVSLPIHPELYYIKKVQNAFERIELSMQNYLNSIRATSVCDISYVNLAPLGAEFPEHKFWVDPGHFRPEVGERVLQEIELFHANKKAH